MYNLTVLSEYLNRDNCVIIVKIFYYSTNPEIAKEIKLTTPNIYFAVCRLGLQLATTVTSAVGKVIIFQYIYQRKLTAVL